MISVDVQLIDGTKAEDCELAITATIVLSVIRDGVNVPAAVLATKALIKTPVDVAITGIITLELAVAVTLMILADTDEPTLGAKAEALALATEELMFRILSASTLGLLALTEAFETTADIFTFVNDPTCGANPEAVEEANVLVITLSVLIAGLTPLAVDEATAPVIDTFPLCDTVGAIPVADTLATTHEIETFPIVDTVGVKLLAFALPTTLAILVETEDEVETPGATAEEEAFATTLEIDVCCWLEMVGLFADAVVFATIPFMFTFVPVPALNPNTFAPRSVALSEENTLRPRSSTVEDAHLPRSVMIAIIHHLTITVYKKQKLIDYYYSSVDKNLHL